MPNRARARPYLNHKQILNNIKYLNKTRSVCILKTFLALYIDRVILYIRTLSRFVYIFGNGKDFSKLN